MNAPGRNSILNPAKEQQTDEPMAVVHFIRRLDKASQTPALCRLKTHTVDEVRTSPALTSQKYKANHVHILWINSTATVQLKCYRKFCEGCHAEHTALSAEWQPSSSTAGSMKLLPDSSCSPQLPHGFKFSFSSSKTPHNQLLWYFCQLSAAASWL